MKVRVIESFETAKGMIPAGTVINIPESLYDRLKGKVATFNQKETPQPITEGRRDSLTAVSDAILQQAVIDIQAGGIWKFTPDVESLENEINRLHLALMEGLTTLQKFRETVEEWKAVGTQRIKH
mgnify:CR=1 FL=1